MLWKITSTTIKSFKSDDDCAGTYSVGEGEGFVIVQEGVHAELLTGHQTAYSFGSTKPRCADGNESVY